MASTMKKQAKAKAVKKGTFYECGWCGKEGTNSRFTADKGAVVCGRIVRTADRSYCSDKCQHADCAEHNRDAILGDIEWANEILAVIKQYVTEILQHGDKIPPALLQIAKLFNIFKKVTTLLVSGDKSSARKLYDEKKPIVTDCVEDMLADEDWAETYMPLINKYAGLDGMLRDDCVL
jgi:hypothetical protein